jgi:hypothetical protein
MKMHHGQKLMFSYLLKEPKVPTKLATPKVPSSIELEAPKVDA